MLSASRRLIDHKIHAIFSLTAIFGIIQYGLPNLYKPRLLIDPQSALPSLNKNRNI